MARLVHLRGIDAHTLYAERPVQPYHTFKVLVLAGTLPSVEAVREQLASRLGALPLLRSVISPVPLRLFHPVVTELADIDLAVHVQQLDSPGRSLEAVVGDLAAETLPRDRPLWRLHLVGDQSPRPAAAILQLHHVLADGPASAHLLEALFGETVLQAAEPAPAAGRPQARALLASSIRELGSLTAGLPGDIRHFAHTLRKRRRAGRRETGSFRGPSLPWSGRLGSGRSVAWATVPLDDLHRVRRAYDATVSELAIAVSAGAIEAHLRADGRLPERSLTAVVPVGAPTEEDRISWNRNVHTFVCLATDTEDLEERVRRISAGLRRNRVTASADLDLWATWIELYPLWRATYLLTVPLARRVLRRPPASAIVSTVRGPAAPLRVGGAPVASIHSAGVLIDHHLGLNFTIWSYGNELSFTVSSGLGSDAVAAGIAAQIPAAFAALAAAAGTGF
ncbi:MAG: wax ester/triacylglycerol synthase domain-containing protein [Gaiellaceae bacterium]